MLRSFRSAPRVLRILAVIVALGAMMSVSAASLTAAHNHLNTAGDHCDVCITAHMAAREVAVIHVVHAPVLQSFLAPVATIQRVESRSVLTTLTRGPPSLA
jgi:hypothetical protein